MGLKKLFFKVDATKVELEQMKSLHRIETAELKAAMERVFDEERRKLSQAKLDAQNELNRVREELRKDHEIKTREVVSLLKIESEGKMKQLEIDHQRRVDEIKREADSSVVKMKEDLLSGHYEKLTAAMTKLHEEGNVTTKFTQDLALKMIGSMPENKTTTKVITGKVE